MPIKLNLEKEKETPEKTQLPERLLIDTLMLGYEDFNHQISTYSWAISGLDLDNSSIIDIGCSRGDFGNFILNENIDNIDYTGVDFNNTMISIANAKYPPKDYPLLENKIQLNDWFNIDQTYDWSFCIYGIMYNNYTDDCYEYLDKTIKKMYDIVNEGCIFILLSGDDLDEQYYSYDIGRVCDLIKGYKYGIDNTLYDNSFKLAIFK